MSYAGRLKTRPPIAMCSETAALTTIGKIRRHDHDGGSVTPMQKRAPQGPFPNANVNGALGADHRDRARCDEAQRHEEGRSQTVERAFEGKVCERHDTHLLSWTSGGAEAGFLFERCLDRTPSERCQDDLYGAQMRAYSGP